MKTGKWFIALIICLTFLTTGPITATAAPDSEATPPQAATQPKTDSGRYYDFNDVLVPSELSLKRDESFVYDTAQFTAGLLAFTGRVEVQSLARFFENAMRKDNWVLAGRFTSPKIVLLFEKPNKRVIIYVSESTWTTRVEVWCAPFIGNH